MKMVKSLLLGSAAGLVALTGAQAADLPVKAKPVEYVRICSLYGAGFYYIPGTDTCIRVGGHIRAEVYFNARGTHLQVWSHGDGSNSHTRERDNFVARARAFMNLDTRTQTAYGTLRTFSVMRFQHDTPIGLAGSASAIGLDAAFIQWGGFTIGRAPTSFFDNPWHYAFQWGQSGWLGNPDSAGGRFVAAYTHQFGNGISGTFSVEDNKERRRSIYNGANALGPWGIGGPTLAFLGDVRGGNTIPQIVGQLRVEQAWGGFSLSGALVNNHVAYNCGGAPAAGCTELSGHPSDKIGGGVNAAFRFNLPGIGVNDALYLGGTYSVGAPELAYNNIGSSQTFAIFGDTSRVGAYDSITGGRVVDSVYNSATGVGQQLTTAYGGSIAFEHGWNAEWRSSIHAGAVVFDYNGSANAIMCGKMGVPAIAGGGGAAASVATAGLLTTTGCNNDYRIVSAGSRTYWTPVRDLTIGVEVLWSNHHASHASGSTYTLPPGISFKPSAVYEVKDQNVFSGMFAVRRFF
jgi:hypothetical protein